MKHIQPQHQRERTESKASSSPSLFLSVFELLSSAPAAPDPLFPGNTAPCSSYRMEPSDPTSVQMELSVQSVNPSEDLLIKTARLGNVSLPSPPRIPSSLAFPSFQLVTMHRTPRADVVVMCLPCFDRIYYRRSDRFDSPDRRGKHLGSCWIGYFEPSSIRG